MTARTILILILIPFKNFGQYDPKPNEFIHHSIISKTDTVNYHIYSKGNINTKTGFIVFFHGSGSDPLLRMETKVDTLKIIDNGKEKQKLQKSSMLYSSIPFDLDRIPNDYALILISKKGIPFLTNSSKFSAPQQFYQSESLNYRVWQGNEVISDVIKNYIKKPSKVIVIGHSEGSSVVAKLATINKKITNVGFWAGDANTQYYDFALQIRKDVLIGKITEQEGKVQIDSLLSDVQKIENNPLNIKNKWLGHTYKRWSSFTEPSIDNLLKIKVPIYVAVGALDNSVPVEASLLIPIEFIRHKKNNLTFKLYPDYDHSFNKPAKFENDQVSYEFMNVFQDFMNWVKEN